MPQRLIEILVPTDELDDLNRVLEELEVHDFWQQEVGGERSLVRVLLDTRASEEVLDRIANRFGEREGIRLVLLPVEATLPQPEEEEEDSKRSRSKKRRPPISREELVSDLSSGAKVSGLFLSTVVLSTLVAGIGLLRGDVAIVIGAMVIAPLLAPNMALALATTLADVSFGLKALAANAAGVAVAFSLAVVMGFLADVDPAGAEIARRTVVDTQDVLLALAAGSAGALALTSGIQTSLIGVMVAVALLPPLVTTGLLVGEGEWGLAGAAGLLLATNVICVNLSGIVTFLVQGLRPRSWVEADRARQAARIAVLLWLTLLLLVVLLLLRAA